MKSCLILKPGQAPGLELVLSGSDALWDRMEKALLMLEESQQSLSDTEHGAHRDLPAMLLSVSLLLSPWKNDSTDETKMGITSIDVDMALTEKQGKGKKRSFPFMFITWSEMRVCSGTSFCPNGLQKEP